MHKYPGGLRQQTVMVLGASSEVDETAPPDVPVNYPYTKQLNSSASRVVGITVRPANWIMRTTLSSVPSIWDSSLGHEYQELGQALSEMTELQEGDDWKIEPAVYHAATYVAAELMANAYPAPQIFNHGPKSIVFNWSHETNNLYLTISADKISALLSSPERIKRRIELSANQLMGQSLAFYSMQPAQLDQPVVLVTTGAVADPPGILG